MYVHFHCYGNWQPTEAEQAYVTSLLRRSFLLVLHPASPLSAPQAIIQTHSSATGCITGNRKTTSAYTFCLDVSGP